MPATIGLTSSTRSSWSRGSNRYSLLAQKALYFRQILFGNAIEIDAVGHIQEFDA